MKLFTILCLFRIVRPRELCVVTTDSPTSFIYEDTVTSEVIEVGNVVDEINADENGAEAVEGLSDDIYSDGEDDTGVEEDDFGTVGVESEIPVDNESSIPTSSPKSIKQEKSQMKMKAERMKQPKYEKMMHVM